LVNVTGNVIEDETGEFVSEEIGLLYYREEVVWRFGEYFGIVEVGCEAILVTFTEGAGGSFESEGGELWGR